MARGIITSVSPSNGAGECSGFVSCSGRADLEFLASDLVDARLTLEVKGRPVTYNEDGDRATHVRLAD